MQKKIQDIAKVFGFELGQITTDIGAWVQEKVASGKIVGKFDSSLLTLALDPSKIGTRLDYLKTQNVTITSSTKLEAVDTIWKAFEYFSNGDFDYLVAEGCVATFPEEARGILAALNQVIEARKKSGDDNASGETLSKSDFENIKKPVMENPYMRNLWGKLLSFTGHFSEAGEAFRQAVEMLPEYGEPYSNLGTLLWKFGKKREAFVLFTEALMKNPNSVTAELNFFDAGYELQEYDSMAKVIEEVIKDFREKVEFCHHLAICYYRTDRKEDAKKILADILKSNPQDEEAKELLQGFAS